MKDLLLYLVQTIVDAPDEVVIDEAVTSDKTVLTIHASQADLGKIIGRGGRIIQALRDLIKVVAAKQNTYVDIEVAEDYPRTSPENNANSPAED